MPTEYVPGKCNIGTRGRAMRLTTGLGIIAVFLALDVFVLGSANPFYRLLIVIPFYIGMLSVLEGSMSFCVLHASRGTYDLSEPIGMAVGASSTRSTVGSDEWRRLDRRKARIMHFEAFAVAVLLAALFAFA